LLNSFPLSGTAGVLEITCGPLLAIAEYVVTVVLSAEHRK